MPDPLRVVSFSGSDSSGCAGLQADLRTWQNLGFHGLSVVTAVTAQTAFSIPCIQLLNEETVRRQFFTALEVEFSAGKTGMLGSPAILELVCRLWEKAPSLPLVVDPVRASSSGTRFLGDETLETIKARLLPLATVVTPNIPEAEWLVGSELGGRESWEEAAWEIRSWGVKTVMIKGGHGKDPTRIQDLVMDSSGAHWLEGPRLKTANSRGTGCVLSAAITAFLARGAPPLEAVIQAREYLQQALQRSYSLKSTPGPCG